MKVLRPGHLPHVPSRGQRSGEIYGEVADLGELAQFRGLRAHHEWLPPGRASSIKHHHTSREEVVFVLTGAPTVECGDERRTLGPGDCVLLPPGPPGHVVRNESSTAAELLVFSAAPEEDRVVVDE